MNVSRSCPALLLLLINTIAWAQTISLPLTDDTHIANDAGDWLQADRNYGTRPLMLVHDWGPFHALVRFDAAAIGGQTVDSATLRLYLADLRAAGSISVHAITSPWTESSVTWNTGPSFDPVAEAVIEVGSADVGSVVSVDITHLVAQWASGALQNHGVLLLSTEPVRAVFDTKETPGGVVGKLEVNANTGPSAYAKVLDFADRDGCVIDQPGYYVLDRSWALEDFGCVAASSEFGENIRILISADDVTLDLQGFSIEDELSASLEVMVVTGAGVTVRNGGISGGDVYDGQGYPLSVRGDGARIENVVTEAMHVSGPGSLVRDSRITLGISYIGEESVLENTEIHCGIGRCLVVDNRAIVRSNTFAGYCDEPACLDVIGDDAVIDSNFISAAGFGLLAKGTGGLFIRNTLTCTSGQFCNTGFDVAGIGNVFDGNIARGFGVGFLFQSTIPGANAIGNNRVSAVTPFIGAESQTDWGGNVSF